MGAGAKACAFAPAPVAQTNASAHPGMAPSNAHAGR
jgi:hypothetical protein